MKMKKLHLLRPEVETEISRPIRGRLQVFIMWLKCIRLGRINITIDRQFIDKMCHGSRVVDRLYYLCIPKITVIDKGGACDDI